MFVLWMAGKLGMFPLPLFMEIQRLIQKWIEEVETAHRALSPYKIRMAKPMAKLSNKFKICLQGAECSWF